jgi:hypothetical protein
MESRAVLRGILDDGWRGSQLHRPVCGPKCTDRLVHHHIMMRRCRGLSSELGSVGMRIKFTSLAFWSRREPASVDIQKPEAVHNTLNNAPINEETGRGCQC